MINRSVIRKEFYKLLQSESARISTYEKNYLTSWLIYMGALVGCIQMDYSKAEVDSLLELIRAKLKKQDFCQTDIVDILCSPVVVKWAQYNGAPEVDESGVDQLQLIEMLVSGNQSVNLVVRDLEIMIALDSVACSPVRVMIADFVEYCMYSLNKDKGSKYSARACEFDGCVILDYMYNSYSDMTSLCKKINYAYLGHAFASNDVRVIDRRDEYEFTSMFEECTGSIACEEDVGELVNKMLGGKQEESPTFIIPYEVTSSIRDYFECNGSKEELLRYINYAEEKYYGKS